MASTGVKSALLILIPGAFEDLLESFL